MNYVTILKVKKENPESPDKSYLDLHVIVGTRFFDIGNRRDFTLTRNDKLIDLSDVKNNRGFGRPRDASIESRPDFVNDNLVKQILEILGDRNVALLHIKSPYYLYRNVSKFRIENDNIQIKMIEVKI
jgi:hypothetical protein